MAIEYYYHPLSPPSCLSWMVLKELGVEWEEKIIDIFQEEQRTEEFAKLNPLKQVPVLKDGDFILTERLVFIMWHEPIANYEFRQDPSYMADHTFKRRYEIFV